MLTVSLPTWRVRQDMKLMHLTLVGSEFLPVALQDLARHSTPIINDPSSPVVCDSMECTETSVLSAKPCSWRSAAFSLFEEVPSHCCSVGIFSENGFPCCQLTISLAKFSFRVNRILSLPTLLDFCQHDPSIAFSLT